MRPATVSAFCASCQLLRRQTPTAPIFSSSSKSRLRPMPQSSHLDSFGALLGLRTLGALPSAELTPLDSACAKKQGEGFSKTLPIPGGLAYSLTLHLCIERTSCPSYLAAQRPVLEEKERNRAPLP